jgi:ABC-2 type transport system ATP-binding protein
MTEPAVVVRALVREYGKNTPRRALAGLDLTVEAGEVRGLLGPNGAGKTTLCKILSTVLLPTSGEALVAGHDVVREAQAVRTLVGIVLGGERGLYTRLSPRQNLRYWAALYGVTGRAGRLRTDALLERVGLAERADERVETFSRGMKQRLHLARGLVGDPKVVLLDEPTVGMDPVAAREFRTLVAQLRDEGRTLLITTHDMAEAQAVCDRVSLIDNGRLVGTADPRTIGEWISQYERVTAHHVPDVVIERLRALPTVGAVHPAEGGGIRVETTATGAVADVLRLLADAGVTEVATGRPTLEEVYLHVVGDRGLVV